MANTIDTIKITKASNMLYGEVCYGIPYVDQIVTEEGVKKAMPDLLLPLSLQSLGNQNSVL